MAGSTITATDPLQSLAKSLAERADVNRDGNISVDEFSSFLTKILGGASAATSTPTPATTGLAPRFEGFDFGATKSIEKSAKYAFAHLARQSGRMPASKAEAETWFNEHIRPGMEQLGHKIDWVRGDRFQFTNWQGTWVVDFVRGAASSDPALAWQPERA